MSTVAEKREVYSTARWKRLRSQIMVRAGHLCELCKAKGLTVGAVEAQHRIPMADDVTRTWDPSNLEALCRNCHRAEHTELKRSGESPTVAAWRAFVEGLC